MLLQAHLKSPFLHGIVAVIEDGRLMLLFTRKNVRSKWIQKVQQLLCEVEVVISSVP